MPRGKTIKLFLMDGEPSGKIKCSLANWTGITYKIPRTALDKCVLVKQNCNTSVQNFSGKLRIYSTVSLTMSL